MMTLGTKAGIKEGMKGWVSTKVWKQRCRTKNNKTDGWRETTERDVQQTTGRLRRTKQSGGTRSDKKDHLFFFV